MCQRGQSCGNAVEVGECAGPGCCYIRDRALIFSSIRKKLRVSKSVRCAFGIRGVGSNNLIASRGVEPHVVDQSRADVPKVTYLNGKARTVPKLMRGRQWRVDKGAERIDHYISVMQKSSINTMPGVDHIIQPEDLLTQIATDRQPQRRTATHRAVD